MAKSSRVFAYVDAVSYSKNTAVLQEQEFAKEYLPFIVNRALSYHEDSVLAANMMNERPSLDPSLQFLFLLNTLRSRKRFAKWIKNTVADDVRLVAEYYKCSLQKAEPLVSLHTSEQLTEIRRRIDRGGSATKPKVSGNDSS